MDKYKKLILSILFLICLFAIIYSSYKIITWKLHVDANAKIHEETNAAINIVEKNKKEETIKFDIDFSKLKKINEDSIAYIKVNNTNIDYVVVKGKDNSYYLNHNFEKKWNIAGWIFGDFHNKFDGNDRNLIIYGHDTKDGSMFGSLKNILDSKWYLNEDNYIIYLVTENKTYNYQVFSTYTIIAENYYINTIFNNNDEFKKFINKLKSRSIYDYGIGVNENDKILTLSSCIGDGRKRVVLHANLVDNI